MEENFGRFEKKPKHILIQCILKISYIEQYNVSLKSLNSTLNDDVSDNANFEEKKMILGDCKILENCQKLI